VPRRRWSPPRFYHLFHHRSHMERKMSTATPAAPAAAPDAEVVITRVFQAPRALVWDAWTRPGHLRQWMLGPDGWTMAVCDVDLRVGGRQRYVWRHHDGTEMEITGVYEALEAPARMVSRESWGPAWPDTINTLSLTGSGDETTMVVSIRYPSAAARDAARGTGMEGGMQMSFDRLERYLATLA